MAFDYFAQMSYLAVETNSTCNLNCHFCNRNIIRNNEKDKVLEVDEFVKILEKFRKCPIDTVKLQGLNEPFLHPKFDECVRAARNFFPQAYIISATNLQHSIDITQFKRILLDLDLIYLSIDGVGENYEQLRSPASYKQLERNLDIISENIDDAKKLVINFTAIEENIDDIEAVYKLSEKYNLGGVRINVAQNWNEHQVSKHSYSKTFIAKLREHSDDIQGVAKWMFSDCFWPSEGMFVDVFGNIKSCLLNTSQSPLGNLWEDDVRDIFNNSQKYSILRSSLLSNLPGDRCQNCDYALLPSTLKEVGGAVLERGARPFLRIINSLESRASGLNILFIERNNRKYVRKWVDQDSEKIQDQHRWLDLFEKDGFVPKVSWKYHSPSYTGYELEMIEGAHKFSDLVFRKDPSTSSTFDQILSILETIHSKDISEDVPDDPNLYYQKKLLDKMNEAKKSSFIIKKLMEEESLLINGRRLESFETLLQRIGKERFVALLGMGERTLIHGDFTAENILVTNQYEVVVIDPNNENLISTPLVDYAKLFQSLKCGYEDIPNLDVFEFNGNEINFKLKENVVRDNLCQRAWLNIPSEQHIAVNAHLAIHFARLLPYQIRSESPLVPVYFGMLILLLDEVNEQLKGKK